MTGVNKSSWATVKQQTINSDGSLKVKGMREKEKREGGPISKAIWKKVLD